MNKLAGTLRAEGDHTGARRLGERSLEGLVRVLGAEHPGTLTSMGRLALTLGTQGDVEGALRLVRKCLSGRRKVLGEDQPDTVATAAAVGALEAQRQTAPPSAPAGS